MNIKMLEEKARATGVFRSNQMNFLQGPEGPQGDVLHVSDGSGNDIKGALGRQGVRRSYHISKISSPQKMFKRTGDQNCVDNWYEFRKDKIISKKMKVKGVWPTN